MWSATLRGPPWAPAMVNCPGEPCRAEGGGLVVERGFRRWQHRRGQDERDGCGRQHQPSAAAIPPPEIRAAPWAMANTTIDQRQRTEQAGNTATGGRRMSGYGGTQRAGAGHERDGHGRLCRATPAARWAWAMQRWRLHRQRAGRANQAVGEHQHSRPSRSAIPPTTTTVARRWGTTIHQRRRRRRRWDPAIPPMRAASTALGHGRWSRRGGNHRLGRWEHRQRHLRHSHAPRQSGRPVWHGDGMDQYRERQQQYRFGGLERRQRVRAVRPRMLEPGDG
ncbi:hypothetical protein CDEF62S_04346 [Castellaniella defragrans]